MLPQLQSVISDNSLLLHILPVHSLYKSLFLSLGAIGLLLVAFFWLGLALDFTVLENAMIGLTTKRVVGYEFAVLLGSSPEDQGVDKVFRTEIFFSLVMALYSALVIALAFVEGIISRLKRLSIGMGIPLLLFLLLFWVKFLTGDHIVSGSEKNELLLLSLIFAVSGGVLCWLGTLRLTPKAKISLENLQGASTVDSTNTGDDLLNELKERDQTPSEEKESNEDSETAGEAPGSASESEGQTNESPEEPEPMPVSGLELSGDETAKDPSQENLTIEAAAAPAPDPLAESSPDSPQEDADEFPPPEPVFEDAIGAAAESDPTEESSPEASSDDGQVDEATAPPS